MDDSDIDEMAGKETEVLPQEAIRIIGVCVGPLKVDDKPLYVHLGGGGETRELAPIAPSKSPEWRRWTLTAPLILEQSSEVIVALWRSRRIHKDKQLAEAKISFDILQSVLASATPDQPIVEHQIHPYPDLRLSLDPGDLAPQIRMKKIAQKLKETPSLLERTGKLRSPLVTLLEVSTAISEVHPIAKAALATVNVIYRKLQAQDERIEQVYDLVENMAYMCRCIDEVKRTPHSSLLKETINDASPLITRIEKFMVKWATSGAVDIFVKESRKQKFNELNKDFNTFRERFGSGVAMDTNTGVGRVEKILKHQDEKAEKLIENEKAEELLKQLLPKGIEDILAATRCLEGTREDILEAVDTYLGNLEESEPNLLWIRGHPGVGKSTIASTIVSRLDTQRRPTLYFIFQRAKTEITTPSSLWRYMSYKLAQWYPSAKQYIIEQLRAEEIRLNTSNSQDLFQCLVEGPLKALTDVPQGRLPVIIIDGLDECGGLEGRHSPSRRDLLKVLKRWPLLSKKVKLVVTSRPEVDITTAFDPISLPIDLFSGEAATPQTNKDIHTFFIDRFHDIAEDHPELAGNWPGSSNINGLTVQAAGLFIWAKTAIDFVARGDPIERLQEVTSNRHKPGVGSLYTLILEIHFPSPTPNELRAFQILASTIILAKRPLSIIDCAHLFKNVISESMLRTFCNNLQSVLDQRGALRFTHQSFVDFLLDDRNGHSCPEKFRIVNPNERRYLIDACIATMSVKLRFNICDLETSTLPNADVPGIEKKVEDNIPLHLSYSCCFWADHLLGVPFDKGLMKSVKELVEEKFLYWLEAMSLLNEMNRVDPILKVVLEWSKPENDKIFLGFMKDARRFVSAFRTPIAKSAPHIYISALPFAPQQSQVVQHFLDHYPRTIAITSGGAVHWSSLLFVAEHHKGHILDIAFSPDQSYFATCIGNAIFISDTESGNSISVLRNNYRISSGNIQALALSLDGCRIATASSDGVMLVQGVKSGDEILRNDFFGSKWTKGEEVGPVVFSHDGRKVALCSKEIKTRDLVIRVWDVESGEIVGGPFIIEPEEGWIAAIVFSIDDQCVISCSRPPTVIMSSWYLDGRPPSHIDLHPPQLTSVALSPNGQFMAGVSQEGDICIWEIGTWNEPVNVFKAHFGVSSIGYSVDSKHLFSAGGRDWSNVELWSPSPGQAVAQPLSVPAEFEGGWPMALSVNGQPRLAVGMVGGAVAMWGLDGTGLFTSSDPANAPAPLGPAAVSKRILDPSLQDNNEYPPRNTLRVRDISGTIAFSPCGKNLISSSRSGIHVWDVNTGKLLSLLKTVESNSGSFVNVAFSPDGRWIAALSYDWSICIWNALGDSECVYTRHLGWAADHRLRINSTTTLAFSKNSRTLVSRLGNLLVCALDMETMTFPVPHIIKHSGDFGYLEVTLSPDGSRAVLWGNGTFDGLVPLFQMWSIEQQQLTSIPFEVFPESPPTSMALSGDGRLVCLAPSRWAPELYLYDAATGRGITMVSLKMVGDVRQLAFSPNDRFIIVVGTGYEGILAFGVVNHCIVSGPWRGHTGTIDDLTISRDGSRIASQVTLGGMIRIWDTSDLIGPSAGHSPKESFSPFTELKNGWVKARNGDLLFWVPPSNREGLYWPRNTMVINTASVGTTELDFTQFEYGKNWEKCRRSV